MPNLLVILVGPTGSGKTTLLNSLKACRENMQQAVTATTRAPRKGEVDGIDYFFLSSEEFENRKEAGEFLETEKVHGTNWYGSPKKEIGDKLKKSDCVISLNIDGAMNAKKAFPNSIALYLEPPKKEELKELASDRNDLDARKKSMDDEEKRKNECDRIIARGTMYNVYKQVFLIIDETKAKLEAEEKKAKVFADVKTAILTGKALKAKLNENSAVTTKTVTQSLPKHILPLKPSTSLSRMPAQVTHTKDK